MDRPLHSERQGRSRLLSPDGVLALLWRAIVRAREARLFDSRFRGHLDGREDIYEVEEYLLLTLRASGAGSLASGLLTRSTDLPLAFESTPLDMPHHEQERMDLALDLVELLHDDVVALPLENNYALAPRSVDKGRGQAMFRELVNPALAMHSQPLELLSIGHVVEHDPERRALYMQPLPTDSERQVSEPVTAAKNLFLKRGATLDDKRAAVQALAGALEHLRQEVKEALISKDEGALFAIANGFAIRHNNRQQKADYDSNVWLDWIFHVYLATVHLIVGLRDRAEQADSGR